MGAPPAGADGRQLEGLFRDRRGADVEGGDVLAQRLAADRGAIEVQQPRPAALDAAENGMDAAGVVHVLDVIAAARRDATDVGRLPAELVDPLDVVGDARLARDGQHVQHRVRAAAHGHVEDHRVVDRVVGDDFAGQQPVARAHAAELQHHGDDPLGGARKSLLRSALVASSVPLAGRAMPRASQRQFMLLAVNMPAQEPHVGQPARSRARSPAADIFPSCLAAAPTKTSMRSIFLPSRRAAGLHRTAADEDRRDIAADRGHQHAGNDLVAIRDADHAVETMGVEHRLHRIGDDLAAGQRVFHARVTHGDAVVHADRVEDERHAASLANTAVSPNWPTLSKWTWPGMMSTWLLQMAMNGFLKSPSRKPVARRRLRWGARTSPNLIVSDRMVFFPFQGENRPMLNSRGTVGRSATDPAVLRATAVSAVERT